VISPRSRGQERRSLRGTAAHHHECERHPLAIGEAGVAELLSENGSECIRQLADELSEGMLARRGRFLSSLVFQHRYRGFIPAAVEGSTQSPIQFLFTPGPPTAEADLLEE
jgi:hypothetical protein